MKTKQSISYYILLTTFFLFSNLKSQSPFGGFIKFDGIDDVLSVSASSLFPTNSDFTIEFWYRSCEDTLLSHQAILGNSNNIELNMFPGSTKTHYQLCAVDVNNTWVCNQDHQYSSDLKWHHFAATYNNHQEYFNFFYDGIDGTLSSWNNYDFSANGPLYIGRSGYQSWIYNNFNGFMDELRISNVIRYTSDFITDSNEFISDVNTTGLWHFNESNYTNHIRDYSGNNNHLSATGNPVIFNEDSLITQVGNTLVAPSYFDSYQWVDCKQEQVLIAGATSQSYTPLTNGNYAVVVNDSLCPLTISSSCFTFNLSGMEEVNRDFIYDVFPNPTNGFFNVETKITGKVKIEVINPLGCVIYATQTKNKLTTLDLSIHKSGVYTIKVFNDKHLCVKKVIKK